MQKGSPLNHNISTYQESIVEYITEFWRPCHFCQWFIPQIPWFIWGYKTGDLIWIVCVYWEIIFADDEREWIPLGPLVDNKFINKKLAHMSAIRSWMMENDKTKPWINDRLLLLIDCIDFPSHFYFCDFNVFTKT